MQSSIRKKAAMLLGLAALAFAPAVSALPGGQAAHNCIDLSGTFAFTIFQFTSQTTAYGEGNVYVNGVVAGTFTANYSNIQQQGQGVTQMNGKHIIVMDGIGTLHTCDEIRLQSDEKTPSVVRANSRLYVVTDQDSCEGVVGLLHTHGEVDLADLSGGIDFKGQVCLP